MITPPLFLFVAAVVTPFSTHPAQTLARRNTAAEVVCASTSLAFGTDASVRTGD